MLARKIILGLSFLICQCYCTAAEDAVLHRVRRLINGDALPDGQPWMTVLAYKNTQPLDERPYLVVCGSVLISAQHVLITAHCLDPNIVPPRQGATLYIVMGLTDNTWGATDDVQEFALDGISATATSNPDYAVGTVFENDVAVITLSMPCHMTNTVQPVELLPADIKDGRLKDCQFYGWGVTGEPVTDAVFTQYLRTAPLTIIKPRKCRRDFPFLTDDHICAQGTSYPCFGDSGSPLLCRFRKNTYLVGLNSFRRSGACDLQDIPQVYTRVATFLDFISSVTDA